MNTGIKSSVSDFIAFQGSDDEWLPKKLEKEMNIFKKSSSEIGVVYSGIWSIENNKKKYISHGLVLERKKVIFIMNFLKVTL